MENYDEFFQDYKKNQNKSEGDSILELVRLKEHIGHVYGSDTICIFLYSIVKRERPLSIVELGTGLGVSTLWMARALRENGVGHIYTVDDGRDSYKLKEYIKDFAFKNKDIYIEEDSDCDNKFYYMYLEQLIKKYDVEEHVSICRQTLDLHTSVPLNPENYPFLSQSIDLLFSDIDHGPETILDVLAQFLPYMAEYSSIFIDSASTHLPSYLTLECIINDLNRGKVPQRFLAFECPQTRFNLMQLVLQRRFRLIHLTEKVKRYQNSTAWIVIEPNEYTPNPNVSLH
ncbi:conserved hypothetical protein [[Clostridium] ultunense Esp]|nr:conserved hypothetical protein [[Clostridium] ultunense Esp]